MRPPIRPNAEEAASLAVAALVFLSEDPERLEPFLARTGLGPGNLRKAASEPGFLIAVLDHLVQDEPLLLAAASGIGVAPERLAMARDVLDPPGFDG